MARRLSIVLALTGALMALGPAAFACGGLIAPGHAEVLRRATTLAAWHNGEEHYITGFEFAGSASKFGYIIPLPGVPSKIQKGGDWTLERLERELNPQEGLPVPAAARAVSTDVAVIQRVSIEALDITVVRGGGRDVAAWAERNGFDLTPDTPTVLGGYRANIFALARFNRARAAERGLIEGQGTTIHFTIPTRGPWIPLRILALGKVPNEEVLADLFVLTDDMPPIEPGLARMPGMSVKASDWASPSLLADLRSDRGMEWVPSRMWLTALELDTTAKTVNYDLAISGAASPAAQTLVAQRHETLWVWVIGVAIALGGLALLWVLWRPAKPAVGLAAS